MKKFLTVFLALVTVATVSLSACNKKENTPSDDDNDWDNEFYNTGKNSDTSDTSDTSDSGNNGSGTNNGGSNNGGSNNSSNSTWTETNDTVYALTALNFYSTNDTNKLIANWQSIYLEENDAVNRTAISSDGLWAKVLHNGNTYYTLNFLLSKHPINFATVDSIPTTVINNSTDPTREDTINLRGTPWINTYTDKMMSKINTDSPAYIVKTVTQSETKGKLWVIGYDQTNQCAKVKYDADGKGIENAAVYYVYSIKLELYKTSSGGNNNRA